MFPHYFPIYHHPLQMYQPSYFNQIGLRSIALNNLNHRINYNEADDIPDFEDDDEYLHFEFDSLNNEDFDEFDIRVLSMKKSNNLNQKIM